ncbi:MAG: Lrp/AsnC family transcriptional regulator [Castellaniella sp.]|uniref:Lrp/AsnC family transcriptional regulator n=1 Tax=Castellaniella sp. TaxID=1955812 RepID=UPI002A369984|nr:Lrp/AsnC family transcriptional regulator [Castellaniella sp.]MDY0310356.1 Lrp/AsnC family transcriptional regulator [Castellaniella sp.]
MTELEPLDLALIENFQHGMPICARPYAAIAQTLGCTEQDVLDRIAALTQRGVLSRVGPVFEHRRAGASTLAALSVPPTQLDAVAARVSAHPAVNHNYQRDHAWNLWFVLTAADPEALATALSDIAAATGLEPISLPMQRGFHIDLGFSLRPFLPEPA